MQRSDLLDRLKAADLDALDKPALEKFRNQIWARTSGALKGDVTAEKKAEREELADFLGPVLRNIRKANQEANQEATVNSERAGADIRQAMQALERATGHTTKVTSHLKRTGEDMEEKWLDRPYTQPRKKKKRAPPSSDASADFVEPAPVRATARSSRDPAPKAKPAPAPARQYLTLVPRATPATPATRPRPAAAAEPAAAASARAPKPVDPSVVRFVVQARPPLDNFPRKIYLVKKLTKSLGWIRRKWCRDFEIEVEHCRLFKAGGDSEVCGWESCRDWDFHFGNTYNLEMDIEPMADSRIGILRTMGVMSYL